MNELFIIAKYNVVCKTYTFIYKSLVRDLFRSAICNSPISLSIR